MTLRLDMLGAARRAAARWPEPAARAARFLLSQVVPTGGFRNRAGAGDLYYTLFGLDALHALGADVSADGLDRYLRSFGGGDGLDLIHVTCLARAWAALPPGRLDSLTRLALLRRVESFRASDGGYAPHPGSPRGTVYGCFLSFAACQDLGVEMRDREGLLRCVQSLAAADGAFANEPGIPLGTTPTTAAALLLFRELGVRLPPGPVDWLLARGHPSGGFAASPVTPIPDLLSTAVALHALAAAGAPLDGIRQPCADFILGLQTPGGGFRGHATDDRPDCEYTFYALLGLGTIAG
jgi:prenyltransferase beta subunit